MVPLGVLVKVEDFEAIEQALASARVYYSGIHYGNTTHTILSYKGDLHAVLWALHNWIVYADQYGNMDILVVVARR